MVVGHNAGMSDLVTIHTEPFATVLTLDDGKANALSPAMLAALDAGLDVAADRRLPLVVTGRPGVFSGGFDLSVMQGDDHEARTAMVFAGFEVAHRLLALPVPVVVGCTGHAIAMGVFLLLSGDHTVGAAGSFRIGANETALGIVMPEFGIEITRQRLTPAACTRALVLSELFSPEDARTAGFLDEIVGSDAVLARALELAERYAAFDADVYAATKERVRGGAVAAVRAAIDGDVVLRGPGL